jgi:hypothetical protein
MASGNTLAVFSPLHNQSPASSYATLGSRNAHPTLEFLAGADNAAIFGGMLPRNYSGNGITLTLVWMAASATSGNARWLCDWERLQNNTTNAGSDAFDGADAQAVNSAAPGTSGIVTYQTLAFTNAQIGGLMAGEAFRLRVKRNGSNGGDTMTGNAQLLRVEVKET